jgi:KaiC/GvpD/RAD55 family RecA-like ATPase
VRALWRLNRAKAARPAQPNGWVVPFEALDTAFRGELRRSAFPVPPDIADSLIVLLRQGTKDGLVLQEDAGNYRVRKAMFHPRSALGCLLHGVRRSSELKYYAMRSLRVGYDVQLSARFAQAIKRLAAKAHDYATDSANATRDLETLTQVLESEANAIATEEDEAGAKVEEFSPEWVHLFLELCATTEALRPAFDGGLEFEAGILNAEHLLTQLFGFPTSIAGFDDLFRGGLLLSDCVPSVEGPGPEPSFDQPTLGARTVLVAGPFGSGKSLLSLMMAVEVARKGGIAWVMAVEQSPEECIYSLESIGVGTKDPAFEIVRSEEAIVSLLRGDQEFSPERGILVFCPPDDSYRAQFLDALSRESGPRRKPKELSRFEEKAATLSRFPLSILIVDPISALAPAADPGDLNPRTSMAGFLRTARSRGVNVWLTSEEVRPGPVACRFEENIADTVIQLTFDNSSFDQRFIQVTKSRLQRARAGPHILHLGAPCGLRASEPTGRYAGLSARYRSEQPQYIPTYVPGLDDILGPRSVACGDILALDGISGTAKTLFGLLFLRGADFKEEIGTAHSLFISDFSLSRMRELWRLACEQPTTSPVKPPENIALLPIESGFTDPADVLRQIQNELRGFQDRGKVVDRVLVTNLSRWELEMPRLQTDPVFGVALLQLLRSSGATSAIVTGYSEGSPQSTLRNVLLESSDCTFEFRRIEFRGQGEHFLRVLKTHDMLHRKGSFPVVMDQPKGLRVRPKESLLRVGPTGVVTPVRAVLFLHAETLNHTSYNDTLVGALRTSVLPSIDVQSHTWRFDPNVLMLGPSSAIDELQIIQLDEFQVQSASAGSTPTTRLYSFPLADKLLADRLDRMREHCVQTSDGRTVCVAVPLYANISLLAFRRAAFPKGLPTTWEALAERCRDWESRRANRGKLYFACQVAESDRFESYNCFFLEILYSLQPPPVGTPSVDLKKWLESNPDSVQRAARCFRQLVRRCHLKTFRSNPSTRPNHQISEAERQQAQISETRDALVWRHWYNTLNQMLSSFDAEELKGIEVRPLFGPEPQSSNSRMTTAGEWYLAVPPYSAAPEVAFDVIASLTTYEKEMERVHLGVGLPTRTRFYENDCGHSRAFASKYFEFDMPVLRDLVQNAFRRSTISRYDQISETLAANLVRLLELPASQGKDAEEKKLDERIKATIESLIGGIE